MDEEKNVYLVIHSGSRNLGKQVADHYQNIAIDLCAGKGDYYIKRENMIEEYKRDGKENLLQSDLKELKARHDALIPHITI